MLSSLNPACSALFKKKEEKQVLSKNFNTETIINSKFKSATDGIYTLRFAILAPERATEIYVDTSYDALKESPIKNLAFRIGKADKLAESEKIETQNYIEEIDSRAESILSQKDPIEAYERISSNKHIIHKRYIFDRNLLVTEKNLEKDFFLEIEFEDSKKKLISLGEKLFNSPAPVLPSYLPSYERRENESEKDKKEDEKRKRFPSPNFTKKSKNPVEKIDTNPIFEEEGSFNAANADPELRQMQDDGNLEIQQVNQLQELIRTQGQTGMDLIGGDDEGLGELE